LVVGFDPVLRAVDVKSFFGSTSGSFFVSAESDPPKETTTTLTIDQTDEIVLAASQPEDGAIEDCEVSDTTVTYFFVGLPSPSAAGAVTR
jgi:hypothetical protein